MPTTSRARRSPDPLRPRTADSRVADARNTPVAPARTTESPLALPSLTGALAVFGRVLRLRCSHCGRGAVLTLRGTVRDRCGGCGFRYKRSDDNYFSGAMFFGLLIGEAIFAVTLLAAIVISWPDVPWNALTYIAPIGMLVVMILLIPVSKVIWLGVDVLVRPVTPAELGRAQVPATMER